jgi:hypothetical protein
VLAAPPFRQKDRIGNHHRPGLRIRRSQPAKQVRIAADQAGLGELPGWAQACGHEWNFMEFNSVAMEIAGLGGPRVAVNYLHEVRSRR